MRKRGRVMLTFFFLAASLIGACIHLFTQKRPRTKERVVEVFLLWILFVSIGLQGLLGFAGHAFIPDQIAKSIGWAPGSPFQFEVAIADLSYGVLGVLCIWLRGNFWFATGIGAAILYLGDAYGHLVQMLRYNNYAPNNSGLFLVCEILMGLILVGLLIVWRLWSREAQKRQFVSPSFYQ